MPATEDIYANIKAVASGVSASSSEVVLKSKKRSNMQYQEYYQASERVEMLRDTVRSETKTEK